MKQLDQVMMRLKPRPLRMSRPPPNHLETDKKFRLRGTTLSNAILVLCNQWLSRREACRLQEDRNMGLIPIKHHHGDGQRGHRSGAQR